MNREDPMTRWTDALATLALAIALPAAAPSSAQAQAQADTTWICFAPTSVEENSGNATKAMDAARETFTSYLTGPSLATYPLKAKLESQVRQEAKQADCPYLLLTTLKHVQKKSGGSVFGKMAAGAAQQGAWEAGVASGSAAGRVAGQAAYGAAGQAAYNYAVAVHNKDGGWYGAAGKGRQAQGEVGRGGPVDANGAAGVGGNRHDRKQELSSSPPPQGT
jgi:hypothetical protein